MFVCAAAVPVGSRPPVIFIIEHDVLKGGKPLHTIDRHVRETGQDFGDGAHIIYVNGEMREGDTALARLMHDFFCADPEEMYYPEQARTVAFHKTDSEEVRKMSGVFEAFAEEMRKEGILIGKEQGISIGAERARQAFARRLLADGFSVRRLPTVSEGGGVGKQLPLLSPLRWKVSALRCHLPLRGRL